jgi:hypothetical protein
MNITFSLFLHINVVSFIVENVIASHAQKTQHDDRSCAPLLRAFNRYVTYVDTQLQHFGRLYCKESRLHKKEGNAGIPKLPNFVRYGDKSRIISVTHPRRSHTLSPLTDGETPQKANGLNVVKCFQFLTARLLTMLAELAENF